MKKLIVPKSDKKLLRTHPIISKYDGWFIKFIETSNSAFLIEATDRYGRVISKRGSDPDFLIEEIEKELCGFAGLS